MVGRGAAHSINSGSECWAGGGPIQTARQPIHIVYARWYVILGAHNGLHSTPYIVVSCNIGG